MQINGHEVGFAMTIGALKELAERCPEHDIEKIDVLFSSDDIVKTLDNMAWFISVLNRWYIYRNTKTFDGALEEADILAMDVDEVKALFGAAMRMFRNDSTPETQVEPVKKPEAAPETES